MSRSLKFCAFFFLLLLSASLLFSQNPEPTGWYAGDMHVHRSCGNSPVAVTTLKSRMSEENLAVMSLLADMGNAEVQNATTDLPKVNGQDDASSTAGRIVHWDTEWHWDATYSQYGHQALGGHLVALGLKEGHQIWQESTWPILSWAHQQNGIAGFAHMQYLNNTIQTSLNCCIPMEYPVEVALGAADFVSEDVGGGDDAMEAYYRLLNSGFRPGLAAGTDYPCNDGSIGNPLTYVRVDGGNMTYRNWVEGISNGRTVVSRNGHREFLDLKVNGIAAPGDEIRLAGTGSVTVTVTWTASQNYSGTIELLQNGEVVASKTDSIGSGESSTLSATVNFLKSGWLAARRIDGGEHKLHTAAIFVTVANAPVRANATDPNFFVDWTNNLLTKTSSGGEWNWYFPTTLSAVQTRYRSAKALYQQIASEAQGTSVTLSSITVTPTNQTIAPNTTQQYKATGTYSNGTTLDLTGQVTWSSSNPSLIKVNLRGLAVAVNTGSAVISATLGGLSDSTSAVAQSVPLTITTDSLAAGTVGTVYSVTLAASGGTPSYTWSRTSGTLPTGITLNATTGVLSGTPTAAGTFTFTLQVADASSPVQTASKAFSIVVGSSGGGTVTCPCSVFGNTTPALVDSGADSPVELGMKFQSDVAGLITAIRFYKSAGNTGTHIGNLWSSTGTKLATVTFANETTSGWQQATLTPAVSITAGTVYVVSYHSTIGHYSDDYPYFGSAKDNAPLHAPADGVSGANGVYAYGSSSVFPNSGWNSSNYWVDVVFATNSTPTYTISGTVSGAGASGTTVTLSGAGTGAVTTDAAGAFSFSGLANGAYTLTPSKTGYTFSPTSQAATVNGANVTNVTFASTAQVVQYNITGTITGPGANAATVTLSGAGTGIATSDSAGNYTFANLNNGSYTVTPSKTGYTFTPASTAVTVNGANVTAVNLVSTANSGGAPNCPCNIWNSTASPAILSETDTAAVELGVRFRADVDGVITGLRFYKGPNNTGTHIGNLWTNAGAVLGSVVFTNETASGWQQMNFSQPIAIKAGTTYVASYHTDTGGYSYTGNYFTTAFDNAPLHALADGLDGVNGVFRYGTSGFPSSGFQSGNYWVDVVFTTTTVQSHSISGTVSGPGANGAVLTLSGAASAATTADPTGSYTFSSLANGTYAVAASKAGYTYSGPVQNIAVAGADVTGINFTSAAQGHSISGTVSGPGANGATLTLSGAASATTTAGPTGSYTFSSLADGTYAVAASKAGYTYSGPMQNIVVAGADVAGINFTSATQTFKISGTVTGAGASGAVISLTGAATSSTTTDSSGAYSFLGLANGSYTLTASKAGFVFAPASQNVTIAGADAVATTFASTATYAISGTITGAGAASATVTLSGGASGTTTTDAGGNFSFTVVNGAYTITPTKSGYAFTPTNRGVTVSGAAVAGVNFSSTASGPTCPCSIWSGTTVPAVAADSDTKAVELGVRFRSDVNGYITGIRYYKSSTNTGTHTGTLWSNTGTKLVTATFSGETSTGWQTVMFAQPVAVTAGTTYVASYHTNSGHYAANVNYFGATFDNAPLHALASGASGNNGVYRYSTTSAFPNSTYQKTNYWVDIVFTTTLP